MLCMCVCVCLCVLVPYSVRLIQHGVGDFVVERSLVNPRLAVSQTVRVHAESIIIEPARCRLKQFRRLSVTYIQTLHNTWSLLRKFSSLLSFKEITRRIVIEIIFPIYVYIIQLMSQTYIVLARESRFDYEGITQYHHRGSQRASHRRK